MKADEVTRDDERLARVTCPKCKRAVPEPLPRGSLVPVVHSPGGRAPCRFWISVAPRPGADHLVRVLENRREGDTPEGETFEGTLAEMWPEHRRRSKRSTLLEVLSGLDEADRPPAVEPL